MNGAESLVKTLLASGVDTVFANPGTSEMHFVAALDAHPELRCVLCLFEGGTSGAADAYFRMKRDVAGTLLHLAPGFGNAFANIHNARKAGSGMLNVMGDHALHHLQYESPLKGDTQGISQAISQWTRVCPDAQSVAADGADAIRAARSRNGQIATLILPADTAWDPATGPAVAAAPRPLRQPDASRIDAAAQALRKTGAALMIGGSALFGAGRELAGRIAARTGCRLMVDTMVARVARGAGRSCITQLVYAVTPKIAQLEGVSSLTLLGCDRPVAFFAYPGKPSLPEPPDCTVSALCTADEDIDGTLALLADAVGVGTADQAKTYALDLPALASGDLTLAKIGQSLTALLPEGAIICNEAITSGHQILPLTVNARPHEMMAGTGGSIGWCLPGAVGAAVACPDRKVIALTGDGSAMYTVQSLWSMAREGLGVTVIVFANKGYQILRDELKNVGVNSYGANAQAMFDVVGPELDWVALAKGHGLPATRAADMETFNSALAAGLASEGPSLIEVVCG